MLVRDDPASVCLRDIGEKEARSEEITFMYKGNGITLTDMSWSHTLVRRLFVISSERIMEQWLYRPCIGWQRIESWLMSEDTIFNWYSEM